MLFDAGLQTKLHRQTPFTARVRELPPAFLGADGRDPQHVTWPFPEQCTTLNERIWVKGSALLLERRGRLRRSRRQIRSGSSDYFGVAIELIDAKELRTKRLLFSGCSLR